MTRLATPRFERIAGILESRVSSGTYSPNQKLPSEYDLADEFGVSRLTVRRAIETLVERQVLVKAPGRGTYVMKRIDKVESGRGGLQGFTEAARFYGRPTWTEVLEYTHLDQVPTEVIGSLASSPDDHPQVDKLVRRRLWDKDPMTLEHLYLRRELLEGRTEEELRGSLFHIIETRTPIAYSHQRVEAIKVDRTMSKLLQVPLGDPLFKVEAITYSADARPLLLDTSYYRADRYAFQSTLTRRKELSEDD